MAKMRAKMRILSVQPHPASGEPTQETLVFQPVSAISYPADGSDEDNTYARWSPSGRLELTIANPALIGKFKAGEAYYLDFTRAE